MNELKVFKSYKQTILDGTSKEKTYRAERQIKIDGNKITFELPDGSIFNSSIELQPSEDENIVYLTDTNCPIAISDTEIFINFSRTHDKAYSYDLTANPTDHSKEGSWFKKLFGSK